MDPERLTYGTALTPPLLATIQRGTMAYSYKGIQTFKNPFDWALYPQLLWETKPATIVEVGSWHGGSALWLADTMRAFGAPCHIHSVDINRVEGLQAPGVTFHGGNARDLESVFSSEFMTRLKRPLFVIEDADHHAETTLAVLRFFDRWLRPGEYILVEDGIVTDMGDAGRFGGGPRRAIESFLAQRGADYEIDTAYCDWYGRNLTWNVNGFLRRVRDSGRASSFPQASHDDRHDGAPMNEGSDAETTELLPDVSAGTRDIIARVQPFTMTSAERAAAVCAAVEYVVRNRIPGDFVECGVWKGGSTMAAALMFQRLGDTSRGLHLFDTFEGMSAPTEVDRVAGSGAAAADILAAEDPRYSHNWAVSPVEEVRANMASTGYPGERVHFLKGKVEHTVPLWAPQLISILRLDTDWYESTRHELEHLYPRLAPGGVLIIDDYGHWEGARKAVDEYFAGIPDAPLLCRIDYTGRIAVKR